MTNNMRRLTYILLIAVPLVVAGIVVLLLRAGSEDDLVGDDPPRTTDPDQRYGATGTVMDTPDRDPELCLGAIAESYPPQCSGIAITNWDWDKVEGEESASGVTWGSFYVEGTYDGERFTLTSDPRAPSSAPRPIEPSDDVDLTPACDDPEAVNSDGRNRWNDLRDPYGIEGLAALWVTDGSGTFVANVIVTPGNGGAAEEHIRRDWGGPLCVVEKDQPTVDELRSIQDRLDEVLTQDIMSSGAYERGGVVRAQILIVDARAQSEVDEAFGEGTVELSGALKPI